MNLTSAMRPNMMIELIKENIQYSFRRARPLNVA